MLQNLPLRGGGGSEQGELTERGQLVPQRNAYQLWYFFTRKTAEAFALRQFYTI